MEKVILKVEGMSCSHCENAVKKALGAIEGMGDVAVDLIGKTVTVQYTAPGVTVDIIKQAIEEQGYDII